MGGGVMTTYEAIVWKVRELNTVEIICDACQGLCDHLPEWADPREWRD